MGYIFTIYTALRLGEAISSISSGLGEAYEIDTLMVNRCLYIIMCF